MTAPADDSAIPRLRDLLPVIRPALGRFGVGGLLPILTFYVLFRLAGPTAGILGGMSVSLLALSVQGWRLKRLDPIVLVPMGVIAINGSAGLLTGSVELYLAAPAVENSLWGIALLVSVVLRRPLVGLIARELALVPAAHARSAAVDRALAHITIAWAVGAFLKAGVRLWLLQVLPLESFLVAITLFSWAVNGALLVGSFRWPLRALAAGR